VGRGRRRARGGGRSGRLSGLYLPLKAQTPQDGKPKALSHDAQTKQTSTKKPEGLKEKAAATWAQG